MQTYLYLHDDEVEVVIDVDYDAFYQKAILNALPEDCCPEDSEMTLNDYKVLAINQLSDTKHTVTDEEIQAEFERVQDIIESQCWEDYDSKKVREYDED